MPPLTDSIKRLLIMLFATIGAETPVGLIVLESFCFGFFTSLQYTCMNTLVYADLSDADTSMGSSIASTMQQMSMSFGVAAASLVTAVFIHGSANSNSVRIIPGIHRAFLVLGAMTMISTLVFRQLQAADGENVSQHRAKDLVA